MPPHTPPSLRRPQRASPRFYVSPFTPPPLESPRSPLDFTASASQRHRPKIVETQSAPEILISDSSDSKNDDIPQTPIRPPSSNTGKAARKRRLSDQPAPAIRGRGPSGSNDTLGPEVAPRGRAVSSPSALPSATDHQEPGPAESAADATPDPVSTSPSPKSRAARLARLKSSPSRIIDDTTHKRLRDGPTAADDKVGIVYAFRDRNDLDKPIKIGYTTKVPYSERIEQHEHKCSIIGTVYASQPVRFPRLLESLVHLDLAEKYRPWPCAGKCCKDHFEFFMVTDEVAQETIKKWQIFLSGDPYDDKGRLKRQWERLLTSRRLVYEEPDSHDPDFRRRYWKDVVLQPPSLSDIEILDLPWIQLLVPYYNTWYQFGWQLSTVGYGIVTMLMWTNVLTSAVCALVMVCACHSIALKNEELSSPKNGQKRKRGASEG